MTDKTEEYQRGYDAGLKKGRRDKFPAWYYAENGEIWKLSGKEIGDGQYVVSQHRFYKLPLAIEWQPASFCHEFDTGELIWSNEYEEDCCDS